MGLKFDRKAFRSGRVIVKEPSPKRDSAGELVVDDAGNSVMGLKVYRFTVADKGKVFTFENEAYVLENYPILFTKA